MDPNAAWDAMLTAYATKDWERALEAAEASSSWLQRDGFPPQPQIGTSLGNFTCHLDADFNRVLATAISSHVLARCRKELNDVA